MFTSYDKAIAAFLTSLVGILAMFKLPVGFISPETIAAVTPFITLVVTWIVPNLPGDPPTATPPIPPSIEVK